MACNLSSGYSIPCRDNIGGVKAFYILSGSIDTVTEASTGLISGLSGSGVFYKFEQEKDNGSFTETVNADIAAGTVVYQQDAAIQMNKLKAAIRNQVNVLAQNTQLKVCVELQNGIDSSDSYSGRFFYLGRYNGAALSAGTGQSGVAFADANSYNITLTGQEPRPADEIQSSDGLLTSALSGITVS